MMCTVGHNGVSCDSVRDTRSIYVTHTTRRQARRTPKALAVQPLPTTFACFSFYK